MAQPRVFISSTYYDLRHVRSSLEHFIEAIGFEPILSENGGISYSPDQALAESCYREVQNCDMYVLIVGGRYGADPGNQQVGIQRDFFARYESITKTEYRAAVERDIPIYILIEKAVYAEYQTFLRNRESSTFLYAHVDSVNVFQFIQEILSQPRNNPVQLFDRYYEIEAWLRSQWAGLFRELLQRMSGQRQLATLAEQVQGLGEINNTLRRYLEEVIARVSPQDATLIIDAETERLKAASWERAFAQNSFVRYLKERGIPFHLIRSATESASTASEFVLILTRDCRLDPSFICEDVNHLGGNS